MLNSMAGRSSALDGIARVLAVYGILLLAAVVVYLAVCSDEKWRRWGGWITLISVAPAAGCVCWLDEFMNRPRPFLVHPVKLLLCIPDGISVPSIEMGAAAALAFGIFAYGGRLRWYGLPYLILLGAARVFCGIEYPLDQAWAGIAGCTAALAVILVFNPRYVFLKEDGWPVAAMGALVVLGGFFLFLHMPAISIPDQQSTCRSVAPIVSAEEKNLIKGMSPGVERVIANSLLKLHLPGKIRKVEVGDGEFTSVATVKFDVGHDSKPIPKQAMEREALAIIKTTLIAAPKVSEVDVFGVTTWDRQGRKVLNVAYSVAARRANARFLFTNSASKLSSSQAISRFGLTFYRIHRGRE